MMPGMDIPLVRDEMQRHLEALRNLMMGQRDLAQQVAAEGKALREKNTAEAEIDKALDEKFGKQGQAIATQLADELVRHFEALTKVYKENREELIKQLAQSVLRRMANREPGQRLGGPGFEKAGRPFPKGKGAGPRGNDEPPENF
jgi:ClpP class serine protease